MKSSLGTRSIARRTFSSTMSRARSWRATISRLACSSGGCICGARVVRRESEMLAREWAEVDDPPRDGAVEPDGQDRDLRVARFQGAVAAAAEMAPSREIGELDARRRRDDQLSGVRVGECAPGPLECIGLVEQGHVAARRPTFRSRCETELLAVAAGNGLPALAPEHDL